MKPTTDPTAPAEQREAPVRFTVVVPTRERCETLRHTLRTCLEQTHPGLTVVVSDNASADGTRAVAESFGDPRVRYVNTGRRVSMSGNWEFALGAVDDEAGNFVHYLGDDDALLPGALDDAAAVLRSTGARALAWRKAEYMWPSFPEPARRNTAGVPLDNKLFRYDARAALRDVGNLWLPYYRCPSLYNSFVDARALHAVRRRDGGFFHSSIPDAYSGFAVLSEVPWYLYSTRPFSLNAASGKSTGSAFGAKPADPSARDRFLAENDIAPHPRLAIIPGSVILAVMEAFFQADDHAFGGRLRPLRPLVIAAFFREISPASADRWAEIVAGLEAVARSRGDRALLGYIAAFRRLLPNRPAPRGAGGPANGLDPHGMLAVDLGPFGVEDVHGAAAWVGGLLGPYAMPGAVTPYRSADKVRARLGTWSSRRVPDRTL